MRSWSFCLLLGTIAMGSIASPAWAQFSPRTELVRCGAESCLEISGYRDDPATIISLNGQDMKAEGGNKWRIVLPVEAVRQMSAPRARSLDVSLRNPETNRITSATTRLPIGLLGDITSLASIEVSIS
ncbi:hypothetical protein GRI39_07070 [Altererythrobacter indicus]|uniref:Uncharacterized protein n=1 Tax=Altericroceibacterium indicum TaxID=374177 RepID=A0A845A9W3_9SPHN|nr:hypothetical protein [Altericroceibacterium indicum]MXP25801.1 hypothetical protein [Altericroceibacterium indicum]